MTDDDYLPERMPESVVVPVRGLDYHLNFWGDPRAPLLVMLHGWGDCGGSFQFVVDALAGDWRVVAPDWRGFGRTRCGAESFWFPDYLADLDALLEMLQPDAPVVLVGHSMGGNVGGLYSGIRPDRVAALVCLEGFGLDDAGPEAAPERYRRWLDQLRDPPQFATYAALDDLAARIQRRSPGLDPRRTRFVAKLWSHQSVSGRTVLRASPAHKLVNPVLYRRAEARECWRAIRSPTLLVAGALGAAETRRQFEDMAEAIGRERCRCEFVANAGHMLHLEAPEPVAALIDAVAAGTC